jgi:hypothetical protein
LQVWRDKSKEVGIATQSAGVGNQCVIVKNRRAGGITRTPRQVKPNENHGK